MQEYAEFGAEASRCRGLLLLLASVVYPSAPTLIYTYVGVLIHIILYSTYVVYLCDIHVFVVTYRCIRQRVRACARCATILLYTGTFLLCTF